jgi:uncharacterized alpha/beta hydrolase family protein
MNNKKILFVIVLFAIGIFFIFNKFSISRDNIKMEKLRKLKNELTEVCTEKLIIDGIQITEKNINNCIIRQIQANKELFKVMTTISKMPDGRLKFLLMSIVIQCCKSNKINGLDDKEEQIKCIQNELEAIINTYST